MPSRRVTYRMFQFASKHERDWAGEFLDTAADLPRADHVRTGEPAIHEAAKSLGYEVIEDHAWRGYFGLAYKDKRR